MEELHDQRHELEIQNVINIIYTFFVEKLRSSLQLQIINKYFEVNIYIYIYIYKIICIFGNKNFVIKNI